MIRPAGSALESGTADGRAYSICGQGDENAVIKKGPDGNKTETTWAGRPGDQPGGWGGATQMRSSTRSGKRKRHPKQSGGGEWSRGLGPVIGLCSAERASGWWESESGQRPLLTVTKEGAENDRGRQLERGWGREGGIVGNGIEKRTSGYSVGGGKEMSLLGVSHGQLAIGNW